MDVVKHLNIKDSNAIITFKSVIENYLGNSEFGRVCGPEKCPKCLKVTDVMLFDFLSHK